MEEIKKISRDEEIIFTNWTDEDFDGVWDKKIYRMAAKKSFYLPFYLAEHFAKHLIDRELTKQKLSTSHFSRQGLLDKCISVMPKSEEDIAVIRPKEVKKEETLLKRDERVADLRERGINVDSQVNEKALKEAKEEEFEKEK